MYGRIALLDKQFSGYAFEYLQASPTDEVYGYISLPDGRTTAAGFWRTTKPNVAAFFADGIASDHATGRKPV